MTYRPVRRFVIRLAVGKAPLDESDVLELIAEGVRRLGGTIEEIDVIPQQPREPRGQERLPLSES